MVFFYNLLQTLLLILFLPLWGILLLVNERLRKGLLERLGISEVFKEPLQGPSIWVHAASLGEVKVSEPICGELAEKFRRHELVFSASTPVGRKQAKVLIKKAKKVFLLPLDFIWTVCPVVRKCRPEFFLVAETELWPNLFFCLQRRGVRIALFNGRISDKSFERYKIFRFFFRRVLRCVELFLVQTEEDAKRMEALGAPADRIHVTGNVKFDAPFIPMNASKARRLRVTLHLNEGEFVWVAGSIHPEEFPVLIDAFQKLRESFPRIKWIVIPRHLYALPQFEEILRSRGLPFALWNGKGALSESWDILLVNALGQLVRLYQLGVVAFVGGSLAPIGGHNPLEPLRYGVPTIFGPKMENFREIRDITLKEAVAFEVSDAEELSNLLSRLLGDPKWRGRVREKSFQMFDKYRGATERSIRQLEEWIEKNSVLYKGG